MPKRRTKPRQLGRRGVPVELHRCRIANTLPEEFREQVLRLPLLAYDMEELRDGRKVVVTKPGGKSTNDIMVWIYEGPDGTHWRPSHGLIHTDLEEKLAYDRAKGLAVVGALEKVFEGTDPEDVIEVGPRLGENLPGLPVDLILKAYKWIWVQEDCNYPPPKFKGRQMSMDGIQDLKQRFEQNPST